MNPLQHFIHSKKSNSSWKNIFIDKSPAMKLSESPYVTLWHGTTTKHAKEITKKGLIPPTGQNPVWSSDKGGRTFLATTPDRALTYAIHGPERMREGFDEKGKKVMPAIPPEPYTPTLLKVTIPKSHIEDTRGLFYGPSREQDIKSLGGGENYTEKELMGPHFGEYSTKHIIPAKNIKEIPFDKAKGLIARKERGGTTISTLNRAAERLSIPQEEREPDSYVKVPRITGIGPARTDYTWNPKIYMHDPYPKATLENFPLKDGTSNNMAYIGFRSGKQKKLVEQMENVFAANPRLKEKRDKGVRDIVYQTTPRNPLTASDWAPAGYRSNKTLVIKGAMYHDKDASLKSLPTIWRDNTSHSFIPSVLNTSPRMDMVSRGMATFYHVTDESLVPSIKKKGLFPHKPTSVFGEPSKADPKAVYTFRNRLSDQIPVQAIEDFRAHPAESSHLRKIKYSEVKRQPVVLTINMNEAEAEKRMLEPSYGARAIEAPLSGWIPPGRVHVMTPGEYNRKAGKVHAAWQDYQAIGRIHDRGGSTGKDVLEYFEDRGPKALRESPILRDKNPLIDNTSHSMAIRWIKEPGYHYEEMTPDEYLVKAGSGKVKPESRMYGKEWGRPGPTVQEFAEQIKDPNIHLEVDAPEITPGGQEGRHRALASKLAGLSTIPVATTTPREYRSPEIAQAFIEKMKTKGHDFGGGYGEEWKGRFSKGMPEGYMGKEFRQGYKEVLAEKGLNPEIFEPIKNPLTDDTSHNDNQLYLDPNKAPRRKLKITPFSERGLQYAIDINKKEHGMWMMPTIFPKATFIGKMNIDEHKPSYIKYLANTLGHEEIHTALQDIDKPKDKMVLSEATKKFDNIVVPTVPSTDATQRVELLEPYNIPPYGQALNPYSAQNIRPAIARKLGRVRWEEDKPIIVSEERQAYEEQ